jgi:hypothetical protein
VTEEDSSKPCNDAGLPVKQVRIKAEEGIVGQRKSIVEHPFGTIKRGMDAGYCLTPGIRKVTGGILPDFSCLQPETGNQYTGMSKIDGMPGWPGLPRRKTTGRGLPEGIPVSVITPAPDDLRGKVLTQSAQGVTLPGILWDTVYSEDRLQGQGI